MTEPIYSWLYVQQGVDAVKAAIGRRMEAGAGCSLLEHVALYQLHHNGGRLQMSELVELLDVSPSGVTRLVERLVQRGWVVREQPADNRRLVIAVLTPEGEEACVGTTARVYRASLTEEFTGLLSERDLADLRRIGRKLMEGHGRWDVKRFAPSEE
ncbi:MarR family winged helix-turn-helix transcriptional regulator [Lentzea californiensis]|uniref:MarR family winged helix-turn-helix transcriptional regulator n=1 Tax=Lentzea californiensis TaxID=438851 RepID=UPI0021646950|nr:MarR family transcriptional regulator [Lentzea californiensis]MCR3748106.1 DNA-binding transcriptional regulator, MarR family [Lentzea californiensis]